MPCVCLVNTFAKWRLAADSQANSAAQTNVLTEETIVRVPHVRQPFSKVKPRINLTKIKQIFSKNKVPQDIAITNAQPAMRMTRADLINAESKLGSTIFGPIPAGHRREFFHDRNNIWIWHEDWYDGQNNSHQMTVRYEVRTTGIYKKVTAGKYIKLEGDELENFRRATHAYLDVIKKNLYNRPKLAQIQ